MIILENLGQYRKGRLWIDKLPNLPFKASEKVQTNVKVNTGLDLKPIALAVEVLLSPRHVSNYAFLGVKFTPNQGNELNVYVHVTGDEGVVMHDNIAFKSDEVHVGLPYEYADAILKNARNIIEVLPQFSGGILEFCIAAHGLIGSSQASFAKAAEIIINLLITDLNQSDENKLKQIVANSL